MNLFRFFFIFLYLSVAWSKPLPKHLELELFDGKEGSPYVFLSTKIQDVEFQCHRVQYQEDRDDKKFRIQFLDAKKEDPGSLCQSQKNPSPISSQFLKLSEPGQYEIEFSLGEKHDNYILNVGESTISIKSVGENHFSKILNEGSYKRIPSDLMIVDFEFINSKSFKHLRKHRDRLLHRLHTLGAQTIDIQRDSYLLSNTRTMLPEENETAVDHQSITDHYYFKFTGDWKKVEATLEKYGRYSVVKKQGDTKMTVYIRGRNHSHSSYGHQ